MPSRFDEQRFQAARLRLLCHPALETAPKEPYVPQEQPLLFNRLLAQIDAHSTPVDPRLLADKSLFSPIGLAPSLVDKRWRAALANGAASASDIMDREKLADIIAQPTHHHPGADKVEEALVCAVAAQISLAEARQKFRETEEIIEKEIASKKAAEKSRAFPAEWANLKPHVSPAIPAIASKAITAESTPVVNKRVQEITAANQRATRSSVKAGARCCFCPEGSRAASDQGGEESELLGPFVNSRGKANLYVHFNCGCWAPQVFADPKTNIFRGVYDEYKRGRHLRCAGCKQKGATVGCYIEKCKKVFHYRCLEKAKARKVVDYFAAFCKSHAHFADKESYKLMMKSHTIADVAAAQRESTDGLDAPHSKYTKLRRRDTEIIFSRRARLCSHNGCYDHGKSLFSTATRSIITRRRSVHFNIRMRKYSNRSMPMEVAEKSSGTDNDGARDWGPTPRRKRTASDIEGSDSGGRTTRRQSVKMRKLNNGASVPLPKSGPKNYRLSGTRRLLGTGPVPVDDYNEKQDGAVPSGSPTSSSAPSKPKRRPVHCGWDVFLEEQLPRERLVRPDDDMDVAMGNMARMWSLLSREERDGYERKATGKPKESVAEATSTAVDEGNAEILLPDGGKWSERGENQSAGLFSVKSATPVIQRNRRSSGNGRGGNDISEDPALEIENKKPSSVPLSSKRRSWRSTSKSASNVPTNEAEENGNNPVDVDWDYMFPVDLTKARPSAVGGSSAESNEDNPKRKGKGKGSGKRSSGRIRPPPRSR